MKKLLKKLFPESVWLLYHRLQATLASIWYRNPSKSLVIVGVTGTKGKSTTCNFIWSVLQTTGHKTALTGTANFRIGGHEELNPYHLSMPGPWIIQKFLRRAVKAGCSHAVVEVTSEGIKQHRHRGIDYDVAVFTNLTPEHLPSHGGSFENYRAAKGQLFATLARSSKKSTIKVLNNDSDQVDFFAQFHSSKTITYGMHHQADLMATDIAHSAHGVQFVIGSGQYSIQFPGYFNVSNALAAVAVARALGIGVDHIRAGIAHLEGVPGRMERIDAGQNFSVWVDYAHEKESMGGLLEALHAIRKEMSQNIIVLLGAEGGGRDKTKRPIMGHQVGEMADYVVISNVDPYEDDPLPIIEDIAKAAEEKGKVRDKNLFCIEDRRAGIAKALSLANPGDLVAITGKGAEQSIVIGGVKSDWDDRDVVREELQKMSSYML